MAREAARRLALLGALVALGLGLPAAASAAPLTIGAYYYTWYGPGEQGWDLGYLRGALDSPQLPLLGEYASSDPGLIATHYDWAHRYGVGVFFCSWSGRNRSDDLTIRDNLLPSPARGATRLAIFYESILRLGKGQDDRIAIDDAAIATITDDFDYLARTYFSDPGYYRINGRPVVVLYVTRIFTGQVAQAIQAIRDRVRAITGLNPYLIGDEVDADIGPQPTHIRLFDAITGYTLYSRKQTPGWARETGFITRVERRFRLFRTAARKARVAFVPSSLPGFNDRAVRLEADHYVLPHELDPTNSDPTSLFAASLRLAGSYVDPRLRLLAVTSWNEWNEDTQIEPTASAETSSAPLALTLGYPQRSYGFGLLGRLARFKRNWESASSRPSERKKRKAPQAHVGGWLLGSNVLLRFREETEKSAQLRASISAR